MTVACPRCFRVSHSPADQENRYCGACHLFWGDAPIVRHNENSAEFDCVGCGAHVYSIGHRDETATCAVCNFLREQVEAETMTTAEALQMREHLQRHVEASR
jgi:hypothetical protein